MKRSALPGFHTRTPEQRLDAVERLAGLDRGDTQALRAGLGMDAADSLVENAIGVFALPLGVATNFRINGRDLIIPMVTEEPSVIAAASAGAKAAVDIEAKGSPAHITGQIQVLRPRHGAVDRVREREDEIIAAAKDILSAHMSAREVDAKMLDGDQSMMKVEVVVDTGEAMGANAVNTMCEGLAPLIGDITGGRVLLRILSNDMPRTAYAKAYFDVEEPVANDIVNAYRFAMLDSHRAVTHNKGIMNGIAAVGLATGQDTRALEAGAHAHAADLGIVANGREDGYGYGPLSRWEIREGRLWGGLFVPLRVGTVGGLTTRHPAAAACLKMLGNPSAHELAGIMAAVGLCQNFSALKALATDGIQKGHMRLHGRRLGGARTGASPLEGCPGGDGAAP